MNKRVEFKFYLDIEGETEEDIKEIIRDAVIHIQDEFEEQEPLIEPYQWRDLENDGDYTFISNADLL